MSKAKELGKSVGSTLASNVITLLISVAFLAYFGRVLSKQQMAVFAFVSTLQSWIILLSGLGLATLAYREVPGLVMQGKTREVQLLIMSATVWRTAVSVLIAAALLLLAPVLSRQVFESDAFVREFRVATGIGFVASLYTTLSMMQSALQRFHVRAACDLIANTVGRLLAIGGFLILGFNGFLLGLGMGTGLATVVQLVSLRKELRGRPMPLKLAVRRGASYTGSDMMRNLLVNLDQPLIGFLLGDVALADFFMAKRLYAVLASVLQAIASPIGAKISEAQVSGPEQLRSYFRTSLYVVGIVFIPAGFALMAMSSNLVVLLAGPAYASSAPILLLYGITLIVQATHDIWNEAVLRLLPGYFMILQNAAISAGTYGMYIVLLPFMGSRGIPLAAAAGWLSAILTAMFNLRRRVGLTCPREVYTRSLACGAAVGLAVWLVAQLGSARSPVLFGVMLVVGAAVYGVAFFLVAPPEVRVFVKRITARLAGARIQPA